MGPRALGNRSIIVDPRMKDAKDLLNLKIKRESLLDLSHHQYYMNIKKIGL